MTTKNLNWNEQSEGKFTNYRKEMRIRLADLASTNSWNQVVLGSYIKRFIKKSMDQQKEFITDYRNIPYD